MRHSSFTLSICFLALTSCSQPAPLPSSQLPANATTRLPRALSTSSVHPFTQITTGAPRIPNTNLVAVGGELFGTTYYGGTLGLGTVYQVNAASGAGSIVRYLSKGKFPDGALAAEFGNLYGTTVDGGKYREGAIFEISQASGAVMHFYSFKGGTADGAAPQAGMIYANGTFYGTTTLGGAANKGTVFEFNPHTGKESVLYSFQGGSDGAIPSAPLVYANSELYGTTSGGGGTANSGAGWGTVFQINPTSGAESVLHSFQGGAADGANPTTGLVAANGLLYGTTSFGGSTIGVGAFGEGTVFQIDPSTGAEALLHRFLGEPADGNTPGTLLFLNGELYATTTGGGTSGTSTFGGYGTVIELNAATGAESVLYNFPGGTAGAYPAGITYANGDFYGPLSSGGANGNGAIFEISPPGSESLLYSF